MLHIGFMILGAMFVTYCVAIYRQHRGYNRFLQMMGEE